jgi:hypothetical protein
MQRDQTRGVAADTDMGCEGETGGTHQGVCGGRRGGRVGGGGLRGLIYAHREDQMSIVRPAKNANRGHGTQNEEPRTISKRQ